MEEVKINFEKNILVATIWFAISIAIVCCAIAVLFSEAPILSISLIGIAYIIFMVGRQRTYKYYLEANIFDKRLLWLGLGIAIFAGVSAVFISKPF